MFKYDLQLFSSITTPDSTINTTGSEGLSTTMKEYYNTQLLENARNDLYFDQFGKKQGLPKNNGKKVEWRKWDTFDVSTDELTEGITPDAENITQTNIESEVKQYGRYAIVSDVLELTALDDVILGATEEFAAVAGETQDILIRDAIEYKEGDSDMNVYYANGASGKGALEASSEYYLTSELVNRAATILKKNKTPKINGDYIAIIHPSVAMDLRNSEGWLEAHEYCRPEEIYNGEIGKLHGVRFVETNNAKVDATTKEGTAIYTTYFFGKDAYGVVDLAGAGLEMIVKGKGSAGTADPLDQRSTVGFKFSTSATRLYPERLLCVYTTSSFSATDKTN